jgi:hypothetical protein
MLIGAPASKLYSRTARRAVAVVPHDVAELAQLGRVEPTASEVRLATAMALVERVPQRRDHRLAAGALLGHSALASSALGLALSTEPLHLGGVGVGRNACDRRRDLKHAREVPADVEASERGHQAEHVAPACRAIGPCAAVVDPVP